MRRFLSGEWQDVTLRQFHSDVVGAAKGLVAYGAGAGDTIAIYAKTRYEWTVLDYAIWWIGAISVPIYETSSASQVEWILSDASVSHIFYEAAPHAARIDEVRGSLTELKSALPISAVLNELPAAGETVTDQTIDQMRAAVQSTDVATIVYTSGTTGQPKGCELTHLNLRAELLGAKERLPDMFQNPDASTLLFLPLAHVFARIIQVGAVRWGAVLGHTPDISDLTKHLTSFQPTFLLSVPRVFEKLFNTVSAQAWADGKGRPFNNSVRAAISWSRAIEDGRKPSLALRTQHALYSRLVYAKFHEVLGGRVEAAISGGAPLGERLGHFYRGIGINVLEGYGLTESTGALTVNSPDAQKIGTVGQVLPWTEVRVSSEGELQFRGPQVFSRYLNNPKATAAMFVDGDWLATGDLGDVDEDGFVRVTGRKKEIIITAGGKNVAPAILEDRMRAHHVISQCLVVGEGKPFVAALVTIDREAWTGSLDDPELVALVQRAVDDANMQVSRAEAIRKFVILKDDWTEENGYLTPSAKLRRQAVVRDFHNTIESLYIR